MRQRDEHTGRRRPALIVLLCLVAGAGLLYVALTAVQVWLAARREEARPAQAIIVLGAAQYDGTPSPALRARLDHAATLYRDGIAPVVVVTGGRREGDRFTEATASVTYLHRQGIPDEAIRREVQGRNTWEQLSASARFLREEGIDEVVLVSHPWHTRRLELVAREVGLEASVSAIPGARIGDGNAWRHALRETAAVAAGQLIGFRRLTNLVTERQG